MAKKKPATGSVPVDVHKHVADKRSNIPTRETAAFAEDDGPQSFVVHRDRSLDPQLVWKGKDEQDAQPLEVPAVALHVQEKIQPQALIEDVKRRAASAVRNARSICSPTSTAWTTSPRSWSSTTTTSTGPTGSSSATACS
jgi:hypothetical protein